MTCIEFDHLTFTYPGAKVPALNKISLKIPKGAFMGVIGVNNAGKSTLLAAMAGILHQSYGTMAGEIRINDAGGSPRPPGNLAGLVGMVLQVPGHQISGIRYTVFEEAALALENSGMDRKMMMDRVETALGATGMTAFSDRSPFRLSGGQQQRLAIACALAPDPDILVLDEPAAFLDPQGAVQIYNILARLHRRGKTIVIAEHRLEWIAEYADRVVALKQGEKVMEGSPETVLTREMIRDMGLDWTRYTQTAALARSRGAWPGTRPLPASLDQAVKGFKR